MGSECIQGNDITVQINWIHCSSLHIDCRLFENNRFHFAYMSLRDARTSTHHTIHLLSFVALFSFSESSSFLWCIIWINYLRYLSPPHRTLCACITQWWTHIVVSCFFFTFTAIYSYWKSKFDFNRILFEHLFIFFSHKM